MKPTTSMMAIIATAAAVMTAACSTPAPSAHPRLTAAQTCRQAARELNGTGPDLTVAQARALQHRLRATDGTPSMGIYNDLGTIMIGDSGYTGIGSLESDCDALGISVG